MYLPLDSRSPEYTTLLSGPVIYKYGEGWEEGGKMSIEKVFKKLTHQTRLLYRLTSCTTKTPTYSIPAHLPCHCCFICQISESEQPKKGDNQTYFTALHPSLHPFPPPQYKPTLYTISHHSNQQCLHSDNT